MEKPSAAQASLDPSQARPIAANFGEQLRKLAAGKNLETPTGK
jgi:hypothetical protein